MPRNEVARGLAVLEAVGGQLYIAVMVARLVGARVQLSGQGGGAGRAANGERGTDEGDGGG